MAKRKPICLNRGRRIQAKAGWKTVGSSRFYFRSQVEGKVAMWLQMLQEGGKIAKWEYEPQTFWFHGIKRGCVTYLPDFKVTNLDGTHYWIEVKGYMDAKSKTKLKRFAKYYPKETLVLLDRDWMAQARKWLDCLK